MLTISFKGDMQPILKDLTRLQRQVVPGAASRAINRAADGVKTAAVKAISELTQIQQKDIRRRIYIKRANPSKLTAIVEAFPFSPNLSYKAFRARQNPVGTAASAWERRKTYRHAFVMPSGAVVTRTTKARFPIKGLRGPSVPKTFMDRRVQIVLDAVARQRWRSEFERELARRIAMQ